MAAPAADRGVDGIRDLRLQIEPEIVAGREIEQPARPDPDTAPVDLVDHLVPQAGALQALDAGESRRSIDLDHILHRAVRTACAQPERTDSRGSQIVSDPDVRLGV